MENEREQQNSESKWHRVVLSTDGSFIAELDDQKNPVSVSRDGGRTWQPATAEDKVTVTDLLSRGH